MSAPKRAQLQDLSRILWCTCPIWSLLSGSSLLKVFFVLAVTSQAEQCYFGCNRQPDVYMVRVFMYSLAKKIEGVCLGWKLCYRCLKHCAILISKAETMSTCVLKVSLGKQRAYGLWCRPKRAQLKSHRCWKKLPGWFVCWRLNKSEETLTSFMNKEVMVGTL